MSAAARRAWAALGAGTLFGFGLALAGMTQPQKVLDFLDITGSWDPSLALVMAGAVGVALAGFSRARRQAKPLWDERFHIPTATAIDPQLLGGSLLFGIGWGMSGYCPGPAIALLASGSAEAWWVLPPMVLAAWLTRWWLGRPRATVVAATDAEAQSGPAGCG